MSNARLKRKRLAWEREHGKVWGELRAQRHLQRVTMGIMARLSAAGKKVTMSVKGGKVVVGGND